MQQLRRTVSACALALAMLILPASPSSSAPFGIPDKADIKDIINHFMGQVRALIPVVGEEARVTLIAALQSAELLASHLGVEYGKAVKVTFDELDDQQQKMFQDMFVLIDDLKASLDEPAEHARRIADNWSALLGRAVYWAKKPLVTGYSPRFIPPASIQPEVVVTVHGVKLHSDKGKPPRLKIGSAEFPRATHIEGAISFIVPRSAFPSDPGRRTQLTSATLLIDFEDSSLPLVSSTSTAQYGMLFTVVPEKLGSFVVDTIVAEEVVSRRTIRSKSPMKATVTGGTHEVRDCVYAGDDTFDLATARVEELDRKGQRHRNTSPSINIGTLELTTVTPKQICAKVSARVGCKECSAETVGEIVVDLLVRRKVQTQKAAQPPIELDWKRDAFIRITPNAVSELVIVNLFEDLSYTTSSKQRRDLTFLQVIPDLREGVVHLRPKRNW
jgi:hypothetical protein